MTPTAQWLACQEGMSGAALTRVKWDDGRERGVGECLLDSRYVSLMRSVGPLQLSPVSLRLMVVMNAVHVRGATEGHNGGACLRG